MLAADSAGVERGVVVWSQGRVLLGDLRPQVWVVLQDLAHDAEWRDGHLVASSSARLVAEHLHIDPGTAAAALRALRDRGVAELTQTAGAGGRFGLAAYALRLPPGLEVISLGVDTPRTQEPCAEEPCAVEPCVVTRRPEGSVGAPGRVGRRRPDAPGQWSQGALDLGTGDG